MARIQEAKGRLHEARRSYRMSATLLPNAMHYLYHVGRIEQRMGNWDEAERIYEQLLVRNFNPKGIDDRIEAVRNARKLEKDEAMWDTWVDRKESDGDDVP
jgi:tetratricopeptide (TPR) repeat protein